MATKAGVLEDDGFRVVTSVQSAVPEARSSYGRHIGGRSNADKERDDEEQPDVTSGCHKATPLLKAEAGQRQRRRQRQRPKQRQSAGGSGRGSGRGRGRGGGGGGNNIIHNNIITGADGVVGRQLLFGMGM